MPRSDAAHQWSRRRFLGAGAAWLGAGTAARGAQRRVRTVSIIHTTDLHGHILPAASYDGITGVGGLARCATCIRSWRRENPHSLVVDVGDVYQGTAAGLATRGQVMIRLFNQLGYDAWVIGNHDFDWGREALEGALAASRAPVLAANLEVDGKPVARGAIAGAWRNVAPWTVREAGGFRIGLLGLTTPGLASWLPPELLDGVAALDPVDAAARAVKQLQAEKVDAVVVLGHMGWRFQDDFANPVREILRRVRGIDVYLAGHSHQDQASWPLHGVLCSQASYHGIHCGRVDLTFDLDSRQLLDRRAFTVLMDDRFEPDAAVLAEAGADLRAADDELARQLCVLDEPIGGKGRGSALATLFCEAFAAALGRAGHPVDGVFHGTFDSGDVAPGPVTVADAWRWIPFENRLVVAELSAAELAEIVAEDAADKRSDRTLWPFQVEIDPAGRLQRVLFRGEEVPRDRRFRIACNAFDAQSAGRRLPRLAELVAAPPAKRLLTGLDTRTALVAHLRERGA